MKHWLKRGLAVAAIASGAMIATAGMASASSGSPQPVDPEAILTQTQEASNTNETNQNAEPSAETNQVNVYAPVAVLSKGSNNGEVEQSNDSETKVVAVNENGTGQSIDQDQTAGNDRGGCGKCRSEGGSQTQTDENDNTTNQNAQPSAVTHQSNEIGSDKASPESMTGTKGYGHGNDRDGVDQSNEAETTVIAENANGTWQSIDQDQTAKDKDDRDHKDKYDRCAPAGGRSQSQTAGNNNTTNQNAEPRAETNQSNSADRGGDIEQHNEAETKAVAAKGNGTGQSIDQSQLLSS